MATDAKIGKPDRLKLADVRKLFRLVGEVRELGSDPQKWRPHMICRLRRLLQAQIVVSSEIHFRTTATPNVLRVVDIGWGCDEDERVWKIQTERDEQPEDYWLAAGVLPHRQSDPAPPTGELVPIKPTRRVYGGTSFVLSQYELPHCYAVDQLGLHRAFGDEPFTPSQHRLVRMFHVELGRLWRKDALHRAQDPAANLPPRLRETLDALLSGSSEKQIAGKLELSRHTIHNYVKALHRRFGVSSRGELLAKAGHQSSDFTPRLSLQLPRQVKRSPEPEPQRTPPAGATGGR